MLSIRWGDRLNGFTEKSVPAKGIHYCCHFKTRPHMMQVCSRHEIVWPFASRFIASTLLLDFGALAISINPVLPAHSFRDPRIADLMYSGNEALTPPEKSLTVKKRPRRLRFLTSLLGSLHTFGLDSSIDQLCKDALGLRPGKSSVGVAGCV